MAQSEAATIIDFARNSEQRTLTRLLLDKHDPDPRNKRRRKW
jgi:hypothetical protein